MSKKPVFILLLIILVGVSFAFGFTQAGAKELRIKVSYAGPEKVDSTHGIHLYLFASPDFVSGAVMPVDMTSVYENGGIATFSGLTQSKVYLAVAYGDFDAMPGPPPSGTPVSTYRPGDPTFPTPIPMSEEVVSIEFSFDDSFRMP